MSYTTFKDNHTQHLKTKMEELFTIIQKGSNMYAYMELNNQGRAGNFVFWGQKRRSPHCPFPWARNFLNFKPLYMRF